MRRKAETLGPSGWSLFTPITSRAGATVHDTSSSSSIADLANLALSILTLISKVTMRSDVSYVESYTTKISII